MKSAEIKSAAVERSLVELDKLLEQAVELMALGERDLSTEIYNQYLAGLEDRFRGDVKNIPLDVLIRRFRVLVLLATNLREAGHTDQALAGLIEANSLAKGPLGEFQDFLVTSDMEIARLYILRQEPAQAKQYVAEATKIAKASGDIYLVTLAGFATGLLFSGVGRHKEALNIFTGTAARITDTDDSKQVLLKAELLLNVSHELNLIEAIDEAASTYYESLTFLLKSGKEAIENARIPDALQYLMMANKYRDLLPRTEINVVTLADILITTAHLLDLKGYWNKALPIFQNAIDLFHDTGHIEPNLYVRAHLGMGDLLIKQKEYTKAKNMLEKARKSAEDSDNLIGLAMSDYFLGLSYSKGGADDKGVELFEESLGTLQGMDPEMEINSTQALNKNQLAFISTKNKHHDRAMDYLEESVELLRDYPHNEALGEAYRLMGEIFCERRQHIQSERALKKALGIFEKRAARYECARCYKSLGENYLASGDLDMANFFFEESIHILEDLNIESDLPMVYSAKARICIMQEDFAAAEKFFYKDFEIAKKSENSHSLAFSYFHIGRVRRLLNRSHSAEDFLRRSLDLFQKVNNQILTGQVMLELALCATVRLDYKSALDFCDRTRRIFEEAKNPDLMARLLLVRGMVLRDTKDTRRRIVSQRAFEDALRILEKAGKVSIELTEAYYEFAMFFNEGKDKKRAVEYMTQAIELCEKLGLAKKMSSYLQVMEKISPEEGAKMRLGRLVDKSAVEQITKSKGDDTITVERKNLSILFTDIRSFTTISETLSLEELTSFLNDFYSAVTQVIIKFHGRINKFIGDEVLCIFNIDGELEDHSVWAVRAALDLVHTLEETNMIRGKRGEIDIGVGVGINTGEVLVGNFGSMLRQDYTAIGDNVNVAARLQGQAKAGEIVVSEAVYEQVKELVEAEDMGEKPLKGKGQPLRLWKILGIKE